MHVGSARDPSSSQNGAVPASTRSSDASIVRPPNIPIAMRTASGRGRFVLRAAPELRADLPPTAIGKDYLGGSLVAKTPSGTGVQLSVLGLLGVMVGVEEGLEINVLGLTFGIDPLQFSLKLPLAGRVGFDGV